MRFFGSLQPPPWLSGETNRAPSVSAFVSDSVLRMEEVALPLGVQLGSIFAALLEAGELVEYHSFCFSNVGGFLAWRSICEEGKISSVCSLHQLVTVRHSAK